MQYLAGFAIGLLAFAGWCQHLYTCFNEKLWGFLIAGANLLSDCRNPRMGNLARLVALIRRIRWEKFEELLLQLALPCS